VPISDRLLETVFLRDARFIWANDPHRDDRVPFEIWLRRVQTRPRPLCLVEVLDPPASVRCSGRSTFEHVKDLLMMGKRAPDDERHLVVLCEEHNVWHPPSKRLREAIRAYLANAYAEAPVEGGGSPEPSREIR
jgi:hypothetical protein